MAQVNNSTSQPPHSLTRRITAGAAIGVFLISLLLLAADQPDPAWGKFWMVRPLVFMAFAGGMGGLCNYLILQYHKQFGVSKTVALIISAGVFSVGLYMGCILGLDGTLWN